MAIVSRNLRHLFKHRGVSLTEVAQATGVPRSTLGEWVAGRTPRLGSEIAAVATYLGVSLETLLKETNQRNPSPLSSGETTKSPDILCSCSHAPLRPLLQGPYQIRIECIPLSASPTIAEQKSKCAPIRQEDEPE